MKSIVIPKRFNKKDPAEIIDCVSLSKQICLTTKLIVCCVITTNLIMIDELLKENILINNYFILSVIQSLVNDLYNKR
jgi:hypothetical protein